MIRANLYFLICTLLLAIGTVFIRGIFIAFAGKMKITPELKELFTFIPAAIFPAIIVPVTFFHKGSVTVLEGKERFTVLLVTGILCYFVRNTFFVICFGLLLLFLVTNYL